MEPTLDNYEFDASNSFNPITEGSTLKDTYFKDKPYLDKQILELKDLNNNSSDYSMNQVHFNTINIGSSSRYINFRDAVLSIPVVVIVSRKSISTDAGDITAVADSLKTSGSYFNFKPGNELLIHGLKIDYGNESILQERINIAPYLVFKSHTERSVNDIELCNDGYYKPNNEWSYDETSGTKNFTNNQKFPSNFYVSNTAKQKVVKYTSMKDLGVNYVEEYTKTDVKELIYYYDALIPLKNLPFFNEMPLMKGSNIDITITLNQATTTLSQAATGVISNVNNILKGGFNPIYRNTTLKDDSTLEYLNKEFIETISLSVGQGMSIVEPGKLHVHTMKNCRLFIPTIVMNYALETQYLSLGQKKVIYEDITFRNIQKVGDGHFDYEITNSTPNMKKLLVVPILSAESNNTAGATKYTPAETVFSFSPSICSPHNIKNFNVQIAGVNVYTSQMNYKYNNFLMELNGQQGVNGNRDYGMSSGLINLQDYVNTYGYFCIDLSRRTKEDVDKPFSLRISGDNNGQKSLDFLCYLTVQKEAIFDISTGIIQSK